MTENPVNYSFLMSIKNIDLYHKIYISISGVFAEFFQITVCCKTAYFFKTEYENGL